MTENKKIIIILSLTMLLLTGCRMIDEAIPLEFDTDPPIVSEQTDQNRKSQARFGQKDEQSYDAVERTLIWSKKYEDASGKNEKLSEDNTALVIENIELKTKIASMKTELEATKWELSEANEFMHEMELELTKWKSDVIGFRDEMNKSQAAQLKAWTKVLKILGAETTGP